MAILNSIGGIAASPPPNPEAHATRLQSSEQLDTTLSDKHYDKGKRAWCVVGGAFAVIWATYGLLASNGVFLEHWTTHELSTYTSEQVGWINGVHLFLTLFLGAPAGALFDKLGSQYLLSAGSVFYLGGLFGLGECTKYWHFMLAYGVTAGIGNAIISTTAMAVLVHWFRKKRGLVNGIVMAGGSLGGVVFPLSMRPLFQKFGWANSIRILAGFISLLVITGNFCIKSRVLQKVEEYGQPKDFVRWRVVFVVIGIAAFDFVLFGALGLLPTFAIYVGYSTTVSYNIVAVLNATSGLGRIVSGLLADRLGHFNVMMIFIIWAFLSIFAFWLPSNHSMAVLYIFAIMFGIGSGSVLSLEPSCIGQLCRPEQYGQYFGTSYVFVSFTTIVCIPIGGRLLVTLGTEGFVSFFGAVLLVSCVGFVMARWAILDYRWRWSVKV